MQIQLVAFRIIMLKWRRSQRYGNRCQIRLWRLLCILVPPTSPFQACSLALIPSSSLYREFISRYTGDSFFCNYTYPFSFLIPLPSVWFMAVPPPPSASLICQGKAAAGCPRLVECSFQIFPISMLSLTRKNLPWPFAMTVSPVEPSGCTVHTI